MHDEIEEDVHAGTYFGDAGQIPRCQRGGCRADADAGAGEVGRADVFGGLHAAGPFLLGQRGERFGRVQLVA